MITRIEALNYRCLKHIAVDVPQFAILVGPNASGKSTFFDVLGIISDILSDSREGLEKAVLNRSSTAKDLTWLGNTETFALTVELQPPPNVLARERRGEQIRLRYDIDVHIDLNTHKARLGSEHLGVGSAKWGAGRTITAKTGPLSFLYDEANHALKGGQVLPKAAYQFNLSPERSALANLPEDETKFPKAVWVKNFLKTNVHLVILNVTLLRSPSPAEFGGAHFRPDGSNVPHLVESLKKNHPDVFRRWLEHVQTVLDDVQDIVVKEREEDRARYLVLVHKNGTKVPSWLISDGTLRFLALTLLAYHPVATGTYLIEEPENGIHPLAIEAVYQSLSSAYDGQILLATHSPMLLSLAKPEEILCFSRDEEGATQIVKASEHPALRDWKGEENLSVYYASGVLG